MNQDILLENQKKRLDQPLWRLICFAMFCFWQMGFIYFVGPSLTLDGKTPLPISMDNVVSLIAVCYVLSILWMIFLPSAVVWTQRVATAVALLSAIGLFLPLGEEALRALVYVQVFCCCLMIGFETFLMVNFFSERSSIVYLSAAYGVALFMIALVQNDFLPISFSFFRVVTVAALLLLLIFFLGMPAGKAALPHYAKKSDGLTAPKRLLFGTYTLVFVGALMAVSGPAIVGEVTHGVFLTYLVDALASFVIYILYKKGGIHPFRLSPFCIGAGAIGFLLMFASTQVSALAPIGCCLIGIGMIPCQMLPLYGAVMMKSHPSRYISPIIIGLSLLAVLVQSSMVEFFRVSPMMLNLVYAVIMVVLVMVYLQIEPFFLFTLRKRITDEELAAETEAEEAPAPAEVLPEVSEPPTDPLSALTPKEREVAELICMGHSNGDIAKLLFISEHTVKSHTRNIYPKLGVHSRFELVALVSSQKSADRVPEKAINTTVSGS